MFDGAKLRRVREGAGMSSGKLAGICGIHKSNVSRWEAGIQQPQGWRIQQLCDLFQVRREDFESKPKKRKV